MENDTFRFRILLKDKPFTTRGILFTVSSIYDPLGFAAPFLLQGKKILQELCKDKVEWDDPIPDEIKARWERWRQELPLLEQMSIQRCYKPDNFGAVKRIEIHHFSDASEEGYGQCSYLRLENENKEIHCSFLLGKGRITPMKPITIPPLELTAALVSVRVSRVLQRELEYKDYKEFFWIEMKFNVPSASHMGGVWERQIKTVRGVLSALLEKNGTQLNDEALHTLMCEAEAVVNSRPLTTDNTTSPDSPELLTPNHLLTQKSKVVLPPPGVFQTSDLYSRKQWRRVQHLTNEFWVRWRKEFLHSLQERSKWTDPKRNLDVGDIVLIKEEEAPRNQWKLARVEETYQDSDGLVRRVKLAVGDAHLTNRGKRVKPMSVLERPIQKLVLLLPNQTDERPGIPTEEPSSLS